MRIRDREKVVDCGERRERGMKNMVVLRYKKINRER